MNLYRSLFFIFLGCIACGTTYAQNKDTDWPPKKWPHDPKNCHHLLSNAYQCRWRFFDVKGTMEGLVVSSAAVKESKKGPGAVSATIVYIWPKDTVRLLSLKNDEFVPGTMVRFTAAKEPELDVLAPLDRTYFLEHETDTKTPPCRINAYDQRILKTTWANIKKKSPLVPKK